MIFRLEYCNKASVTARVDIQKGDATPIYTVDGTSEPFVLFYNNDKGDKSGSFRSSGADINIYETTDFNIDELKTSSETEISVKYYINNILNWSGFVIPDFFSETITGGQGVVSMVASDRLGTLKGATLSGLSAKVSNRALAEACLAQTGLSLPLYTMADFTGDGANIFNSEVLSQRMVDTKGRNVSCYDILSSILAETNSLIVQRNGAWYIVNKLQLEAGSGSLYSSPATSSAWVENTVSFDEVSVGARRTITPVAATVGVYHEHGGGRLHPDNYDFSQGVTGWTPVGGFVASTDNRQVLNYTIGGTGGAIYSPVYGEETQSNQLVNTNAYVRNTNPIYLESAPIDIPYKGSGAIEVEIDVNGVGPAVYPNFSGAYLRVAVIAVSGTKVLTLAHGGQFVDMPSENPPIFEKEFDRSLVTTDIPAIAKGMKIKGTLEVADDLSTYDIKLRIYGGGSGRVILYNSVSVVMRNSLEIPKGSIFKTTQGANYTKDHEIPTVLWGDYLTSGLNGYFYDYPIDDTSSLYRPTGELHSRWIAYGDPDTLPLLQHITRQKARMFSVAHDLLSADIAISTFDPLSVFVDCDNTSDSRRYVVVSARFDFLRSNVSVELEEIAYVTNSKRDYIYSYFGDGEDGISSIGGISGGTTSTGGGLTSEQLVILNNLASWWKLDEVNDAIYSEKNVYSQKGVSAYGLGTVGSGGIDISKLLSWAGYTSEMANYYVPASLLVPFYNDYNGHGHTIGDVNGLQSALDGKVDDSQVLTNVPAGAKFTDTIYTHPASHPISMITGLQTALDGKASSTHSHDTAYEPKNVNIQAHISSKSNPHGVTASQVGSYTIAQTNTSITNAISAIEIGGRNLIREVDTMSLGSNASKGIDDFGQYIRFNTINSGSPRFTHVKYQDNTQYTLSIESSVETGSSFYWYFVYTDGSNSGLYTTIAINTATPVIRRATSAVNKTIDYISYTWSSGGYRRIYNIKLEKGNKATDWTPAPEDQVSDWNETDVNSFAFLKNKPTQLSQFTDNIGVGTHIANTSNPHSVTKAQVGLGNVDNTSDANKPVSTAMQTALDLKLNKSVFDDLFEKVEVSTGVFAIKAKYDFYGIGEVSAYGLGSGGSSGGGISMMQGWTIPAGTEDYYAPANLVVPFYNDVNSRMTSLEGGSALTVNTTGTGNAITSISKAGTTVTANKGATFSLSDHLHTGVYEPVFTKNNAFNKNFGTAAGTVAQGNDSRIINGQTAYGWGNHASAGYALSSGLANYVTLATAQTISGAKTFSENLTASVSVTTPKVIFAAAGWSLEQVGTELQIKYNGVVKQRMLSDGSIVATGEVTAFVSAT